MPELFPCSSCDQVGFDHYLLHSCYPRKTFLSSSFFFFFFLFLARAPPLWGSMKHLHQKIPEVASRKSQMYGYLLEQEK